MLVFREHIVRITVQPVLARLRRGNGGMPACTRMFARMTIRRAVAAQRFAALLARAQMDPGRADLYALFTFQTLRMFDILDCVQMRTASVVHC